MKQALREAFKKEMNFAKNHYQQTNFSMCFYHLERAHILGQRYYLPHIESHWWMLKVGCKQLSFREIVGQLARIIASFASLFGWVPIGNTGGANVSPLKPMPIPEDLLPYLQAEPSVSVLKAIFKVTVVGVTVISLIYISKILSL